jgi:RNA polymerase sigma-70 factor (ECF subfamily)
MEGRLAEPSSGTQADGYGSGDSLARLAHDHGRMVHSVILQLVHDKDVADDLTQEVFLRAIERSNQFDQAQGHLLQWLTGIAKHLALDYLKSAGRRLRAHQQPIDEVTTAPTAELTLLQSDQGRTLRIAVAELEPMQRQIIQLAYFQGLSQSAIATELQQPLGTIKGRTRSALRRLREALDRKLR